MLSAFNDFKDYARQSAFHAVKDSSMYLFSSAVSAVRNANLSDDQIMYSAAGAFVGGTLLPYAASWIPGFSLITSVVGAAAGAAAFASACAYVSPSARKGALAFGALGAMTGYQYAPIVVNLATTVAGAGVGIAIGYAKSPSKKTP